MTLETSVASLTTATTALLNAVNVQKVVLDTAATTAVTQAGIATSQATTATTQAATATSQATIATTQATTSTTNSGNAASSAVVAATAQVTATTQATISTTQSVSAQTASTAAQTASTAAQAAKTAAEAARDAALVYGVAKVDLAASGGAGLVGFFPVDDFSVATSVQEKLREQVCVLDKMTPAQRLGCIAGTLDVTTAFTNAVRSNREVLIPKGYTFLVSGISVSNLTNFRLYGGGKILLQAASNIRVLTFTGCSGFAVDWLEIDGNGANQNITSGDRNSGAGIGILQCTDYKITNNYVHHNFSGAGILAVDNAGAVAVVDSNGLIAFNRVLNSGTSTNPTYFSDGLFINSDNTTVLENTISNCSDYGIAGDYSRNLRVKGNNIKNVLVGIGVLGAYDWAVSGNTIDGAGLGIAVTLSGNVSAVPFLSDGVSISDNIIKNITRNPAGTPNGDGIFVDPSAKSVSLLGNRITNAYRGIGCDAENVICAGNVVKNTVGVGIYCVGAGSVIGLNTTINCPGGNVYGSMRNKTVIEAGAAATVLTTAFIGNWSNFGGTSSPAGYYRQNNRVHLTGTIKGGTTTFGQPVFNLPVGFRPATDITVLCPEALSGTNIFVITAVGDLTYASGVGSQVCLDGVSFIVA